MRAPLVLSALLLLLAPVASAQAPDPEAAVALACGAVGTVSPDARDALPLCPREEPAGPAAPGAAGHEHGAGDAPADPGEDPIGAAEELADEAQAAVGGTLDDPTSAPGRVAALVAAARELAMRLLEGPPRLVDAVGGFLTGGADVFTTWFDARHADATWVVDRARGGADAVAQRVEESSAAAIQIVARAWQGLEEWIPALKSAEGTQMDRVNSGVTRLAADPPELLNGLALSP